MGNINGVEPYENTIEVYANGDWHNLINICDQFTIAEFEYESDFSYTHSQTGGGSLVSAPPVLKAITTTLEFKTSGGYDYDLIDTIMSNATAMKINKKASRCRAILNTVISTGNNIGYLPDLSYQIVLLDPLFYGLQAQEVLISSKMKQSAFYNNYSTIDQEGSVAEPFLVKGASRWRLIIEGSPATIIVQANLIGSNKTLSFSASNIPQNLGYDTITIDNFAIEQGDLKLFYAKKSTGEIYNLSNFIDVNGNAFFDLSAGVWNVTIYLVGSFKQAVFQNYKGDRIPYAD